MHVLVLGSMVAPPGASQMLLLLATVGTCLGCVGTRTCCCVLAACLGMSMRSPLFGSVITHRHPALIMCWLGLACCVALCRLSSTSLGGIQTIGQ